MFALDRMATTGRLVLLSVALAGIAFGVRPMIEPAGIVTSTPVARPPTRAVLFVLDKSGSMSYDPLGGTSKIDMAKLAVKQAAQSLSEGDIVGILVFNDEQQWVIEMVKITGQDVRDQIDAAVETITADGGTEIYPALSAGFDAIRRIEADVRHIILLSDGKSRTGTRESYQRLIEDSAGDNVTLSTIAIGNDADTELLQFLAERGGGRYYFAERPEEIPAAVLLALGLSPSTPVPTGATPAAVTQDRA